MPRVYAPRDEMSVGPDRRAVVIGASMAGLVAARVASRYFDEVVIVERDTLPEGAEFRKGVPQSRHIHVLLVRGAQILERLFPGMHESLLRAGTQSFDWTRDVLYLGAGGWGRRFPRSLTFVLPHREVLEAEVRRRVLALPVVQTRQETDVVELLAGGDGVRGVRLRARPDGEVEDLEARLVIDASGRGSRAPEWLKSLGFTPPSESVINSFLGYASRQYARPTNVHTDWRALFFLPKAPQTSRSGVLFPIDEQRWMVTVAGAGRDYPPNDDAGFLEFTRSLRTPILYNALRAAEPLTPVFTYRRTENQWRHYEALSRWPEHFVVLGDAACAFNPVYGQGMTAAAEAALVLDNWLARPAPALAFQQRLGKVVATPWLLATSEDFRYPTTEGGRPDFATRLAHHYFDRVLEVAAIDLPMSLQLFRVLHLMDPPTRLLTPSMLVRAAVGPGRRRLLRPPTMTPLTPSPEEAP